MCDKIEWGFSRMIDTIFRCYEDDREFREMFNGQSMFCLKHYELLLNSPSKKILKRYNGEFNENLSRITGNYVSELHSDLKKYCSMYDYRSSGGKGDWGNSKNSVERSIAFLNGRSFSEE